MQFLFEKKIKIMGFNPKGNLRFVVHHYIREEQVEKVISVLKEYFSKQ
jgi:hypothetical protein